MVGPVAAMSNGVKLTCTTGAVWIEKNPESASLPELQQRLQYKWVSWDFFVTRSVRAHGCNNSDPALITQACACLHMQLQLMRHLRLRVPMPGHIICLVARLC